MLRTATSHAAHLAMEALLGLAGVIAIAGCVLAWRLAQGPLDITWLVRRELPRLTSPGVSVSVSSAALAWEGFHDPDSPLDIRWTGLSITGQGGAAPVALPRGRVTLDAAALLTFRLAPRSIALEGASLRLQRDANGDMRLGLGPTADPEPARAAPRSPGWLRGLTARPGAAGAPPVLAELRHVRMRDASISVQDTALHLLWQAHAINFDLDRQPDGSIGGVARADLRLGATRATLLSQAVLSPAGVDISAAITPVSPAAIAQQVPFLAPLAAVDAPVEAALHVAFTPDLTLSHFLLSAHAGAGTVRAGQGQIQLADAGAVLEGDSNRMTLSPLRIALRAPLARHGAPPVLTGQLTLLRTEGAVRTDFALAIDQAAFADLAAYWPAGTGGGSRPWIVQNITSGLAKNAHAAGHLDIALDSSAVTLSALSGGIDASDLTVHWLRPVPPLEHASGHLTLDGPDALHIDIDQARQGGLNLSAGRIFITGLVDKDQVADIRFQAAGGVADTVALLNHPRLNLLSRRPIPMQNPAGELTTAVKIRLPLDARVTFGQIGISATAAMRDVHLGGIAAGRDLDNAALNLAVDADSLTVTGQGLAAGIPADLRLMMDFRAGPPDQVLEQVTARGHASPAQLVAAGLPAGIVTAGLAALAVDYRDRRDGTGTVVLSADLAAAAMETPLGWHKDRAETATATARLTLTGGRLTGIDQIHATGPNLAISGHAETAQGQPSVLLLDQLRIGRTAAHGSVSLPRTASDTVRIALHGATLDLSSYFEKKVASSDADTSEQRGQPWAVDIGFDQVILAKDEMLAPVSVQAVSDGLHIQTGHVAAGPGNQVTANILPVPGGRSLTVDATDSGAVLLAAGIADNMRGGHLRLDARYADTLPHAPLTGRATLSQFRIVDAPAIGRLLKAMTLYGAIDLLRGPGLGFAQAVVPFRWQQRVLTLNNARAFSASLGLTAQGDIDLHRHQANVTGTVVPAYFFNQLPGEIPILGKLFSPEKGSGVFAARYSVTGRLADPKVSVNALSALTPGFLRGVFGLLPQK